MKEILRLQLEYETPVRISANPIGLWFIRLATKIDRLFHVERLGELTGAIHGGL